LYITLCALLHQMDGLDLSIPTELQDALTAFGDGADGASTTIQATHDTIDDCKPAAPCSVVFLNDQVRLIPFRWRIRPPMCLCVVSSIGSAGTIHCVFR
jgi:hypothetical protein